MIGWSPVGLANESPFLVALFIVYGLLMVATIALQIAFVRNSSAYTESQRRAALTFTFIGPITFFLASGPCWLRGARYSLDVVSKDMWTCLGLLAIYFLHDVPFFGIEMGVLIRTNLNTSAASRFSFVLRTIVFVVSGAVTWYFASKYVVKYLEKYFGEHRGLRTGAEPLHFLPPATPAERLLPSPRRVTPPASPGSSHYPSVPRADPPVSVAQPMMVPPPESLAPFTPVESASQRPAPGFVSHPPSRIVSVQPTPMSHESGNVSVPLDSSPPRSSGGAAIPAAGGAFAANAAPTPHPMHSYRPE